MGQKTHPGGFRLNTTQEHYSSWYQKSWLSYSKNLERDDKIRTLLKQKLPSTSIAKITIKQNYYPNSECNASITLQEHSLLKHTT